MVTVASDEDAMLDAASRVLARDGVDRFSLEAVAADLAVSRDQLAARFDSETSLFQALVLRSFHNGFGRVGEAVAASADGPEALMRIVQALITYYLERPDEYRQTYVLGQMIPPGHLGMGDSAYGVHHARCVSATLDGVEAKLRADRGVAELAGAVDPRRLAFTAVVTAMGFVNTMMSAQAFGQNLKHGTEAIVKEVAGALGAPFVAMRQLAALNAVSAALARVHNEAELCAAVPAMLENVLDVVDAGFVVQHDGVLDERVPAEARRAFAEARTLHAELPPREAGEERIVIVATPILYEGKPEAILWGTSLSSLSSSATAAIDERDIARLETLASMVGLALENVRLYEDLQAQLDARTKKLSEAHVRLAESEKLVALGKMVAGIVHELNTPLASVLSSGSTVSKAATKLRGMPPGADTERVTAILEESAGVMATGATRIGSVVEQLKRFARLDAAEIARIDVNAAVKDALAVLRGEIGSCPVELDLGDLPRVTCYASRINHVFLNVIRNAAQAQAASGRGCVRVRTARSPDGAAVTIVVEDDGSGIAPDDLARIHDPVFTAKGGRVRAGLGLATSKQILSDHRGELRIASEHGKGTRVTIVLPIETSEA